MRLKIVKNDTYKEIINNSQIDMKRDGGFWTCNVNFIDTDKRLLKRFDRVELTEDKKIELPLDLDIGVTTTTYRTFTTDTISFTFNLLGVVYTFTVKIAIEGNNLRFVMVNAAYTQDDEVVIFPTNLSLKNVRQGSDIIWTGTQTVSAGSVITLEPVTLTSTQWLVAKAPHSKIDRTSTWLYNLALVEPNKILSGQIMPDLSFTQPLGSPTITLADLVVKLLTKYKTRLWSNRNALEFTLSSSGASKLNIIAPDDIYTSKTLFDALVRIGKIIDAFPKIVDWTEIDFEYFNQSTTITTPSYSSIELSEGIDDFATEIVMNAENVDMGGDLSYYPNKLLGTFVISPNDEETSNANAIIELPYKIKRIHRIIARTFTSPNEDYDFPAQTNELYIEENDGFAEKTVWDNLPRTTFWADLWNWLKLPYQNTKDTTAYYIYGDNKLYNAGALKNYWALLTDVTTLTYTIEYEPLIDMQFSTSNGVVLDGDLTYQEYQNQEEKTVEKKANYGKLKSDVRDRASLTATVTYKSDTFPLINTRLIIEGDGYAVTRFLVTKKANYFEVNAYCSSDFNKKSQYVAVDREVRKYEIPSKQIVNRIVRYNQKYKIEVSNIATTTQAINVQPNYLTRSGILSFLYPLCKTITMTDGYKTGYLTAMCQFNYKTEFDESNAIAMIVPTSYAHDTDRVSVLFKTRDNVNNDFFKRFAPLGLLNPRIGVTEQVSAIYTDLNGELESVDFKLVPFVEVDQIQEQLSSTAEWLVQAYLRYTYPFVTQDYFDEGYGLDSGQTFEAINYTGDNRIYLDKDRRETLSFQFDFDIKPYDTSVVIYDGFTANTAFFQELGAGSDCSIVLVSNVGNVATTYTGCTVLTDRITIDFEANTGGANRDITDVLFYVGSTLVLSKTLPSVYTVAHEGNYKITIGIGE
jgi:hypothetical protein